MAEFHFRAELSEHSPGEPGSFHFLTLPADLADDVAAEAGPREGFGSVRVEVRIGTTTWRTSLFPDSAQGTFVLPVKKSVRRDEDLEHGTSCDVTLSVVA